MASRDVDLIDLFHHELAPIPMFENNGAKTTSTLKRKLQIERSAQTVQEPYVVIIDGCVKLWIIHW